MGTPVEDAAGARRFTCRLLTERGLRMSRCAAGVPGGLGDAFALPLSLAFKVTLWKTKSVKRRFVWWIVD